MGRQNTAWIEIVVDNALAGVPRFALSVPVVRELLLSKTVYHEVGHHLQQVYGAALGETVAEDWSRRLSRTFFRRHYAWLVFLVRPVVNVYRLVRPRSMKS